MEEIKYLNLGLYKKPQADLSLTQDLQNVNIGVNGYWHVYKYAQRTFPSNKYDENDESTWNVGVKFKNSFTGTYKTIQCYRGDRKANMLFDFKGVGKLYDEVSQSLIEL